MYIKKYCITLIFLLFGLCATYSQERRTEICVDFRVNSTVIDSTYSDNAVRMQEIIEFLRNIRQDSTINIVEVSFCGAASFKTSDISSTSLLIRLSSRGSMLDCQSSASY